MNIVAQTRPRYGLGWRIRQVSASTAVALLVATGGVLAQSPEIVGTVRDETGGALPGVVVELRTATSSQQAITDAQGTYRFDGVAPGPAQLTFGLVNFAGARRTVTVPDTGSARADAVLYLALSADVTVTGKTTFTNLADAVDPAQNIVGIAQSASQGAITARQLDARPIMRAGEVLETVPGVVISQHSGEGKANQYYLRGFNLDHGTDFATTVAGIPVNTPTHGHGHGWSDLNFLIPELVSGVQFSKGPYFADQGDFATAGAANINYTNRLGGPIVRIGGGGQGFGRAMAAASPALGSGHLLGAIEVQHNDGPWEQPDDYRKINGLVRYSQGDTLNGFSATVMGYRGTWNATDQVPARAIERGLIGRFGAIDASDGGEAYRYSGAVEWQRTRGNGSTKLTAYGMGTDLNLFSNFTYFLDDPENGDQFQQADHRFVSGAKLSHRRLGRWAGHSMQNTVAVQVRNDDIGNVALYHTRQRQILDTVRQDSVLQTSMAGYAQNETGWAPWLRTLAGVRVDGYRFDVEAGEPANSGTEYAGLVSPKGGAVFGPWNGTEFYLNAGFGFHSNDARGATITIDPVTGDAAERVTPLARARGAEAGMRSVAIPHLQTSVSLWTLNLDSELLFIGDAGTTEAGRPSHRYGIEWANYYSPWPWLTFDGDVSLSRAQFTDDDPAGTFVPGAVATVVSAGVIVDSIRNVFGSVRLRYFGSRPLIEDDSVRSDPTSLVNLEAGYKFTRSVRLAIDVFNALNAKDSDTDYFYASRLPGEPSEGIEDIHFHPTLPRTARVSLIIGF
ncbi:MAG TPA: TonB-dependent receptor [Vicinamibacterales bacterium]|nr:TonB-dependent receptor [Vicinamibacterales bacterium]